MTASEFVIKTLEKLIIENPYIKCVYEYDVFDLTHYVKITPKDFFEVDGELFKGESEILQKFISQFPIEGLLFFSEEDDIELTKPIYEKEGVYYQFREYLNKNNYTEILDKFLEKDGLIPEALKDLSIALIPDENNIITSIKQIRYSSVGNVEEGVEQITYFKGDNEPDDFSEFDKYSSAA